MPNMDEMTNKRTMPPSDQPVKASPAPTGGDAPKPKSSSGKMGGVVALGLLVVGGAGCLVVVGGAGWLARSLAEGTDKKGPGAGKPELPPVPVVAGTVAQKDVPIYLGGIGTVQAFNTVTIHARVDGQVQKIGFTEGQIGRAHV